MTEDQTAILVNAKLNRAFNDSIDLTQIVTPRNKPSKPYIPEGSQKRELSIGSTASPSLNLNEVKRSRHCSVKFDNDPTQLTDSAMDEEEVTLRLTAKVTDLEDVAKKEDLLKLQETVSSHAIEIKQLREDLVAQAKRIQTLEDVVGSQTAKSINRNRPDVDNIRLNQHGGAQYNNNLMNVSKIWCLKASLS